ncbi:MULTISPECIES: type II toxin-antitoxin system RelE/ParE family toxin [unclassified Caulobacter]|uniref:type II toxin-antitoxin system RelE/ParE family toxin n=1 Tax=unclassified Caulobacter TaxID=2648921 RepID=UPI0018EE90A9|nr:MULTISPECIES: type II toxin-antitoxin system RelE/ParE family toxin [unclassified Caulobacter]
MQPLHTVASTAAFLAQARADGMSEGELEALERMLSANPEAGDLIVGSGGCRKVRVAGKGRGKSGGFRVVTFFAHAGLPVYLLAMLSKGRRANFSAAEVAAMATLAKRILAAGTRGRQGH